MSVDRVRCILLTVKSADLKTIVRVKFAFRSPTMTKKYSSILVGTLCIFVAVSICLGQIEEIMPEEADVTQQSAPDTSESSPQRKTTDPWSSDSGSGGLWGSGNDLLADEPVSPPEPPPAYARIRFESQPVGATVFVNDDSLGLTPFTAEQIVPGTHRVRVYKKGYRSFEKELTFPENAQKRVVVRLRKIVKRLSVESTPTGATVVLNGDSIGVTPFVSTRIRPGLYRLDLYKEGYLSSGQTIEVSSHRPLKVNYLLESQAHADSVRIANLRKFQIARQVMFGLGSLTFAGLGIYSNSKVGDALDAERDAYSLYNQEGISQELYNQYWTDYERKRETTSDRMRRRNGFYIVSGILAAGVGVSVFF